MAISNIVIDCSDAIATSPAQWEKTIVRVNRVDNGWHYSNTYCPIPNCHGVMPPSVAQALGVGVSMFVGMDGDWVATRANLTTRKVIVQTIENEDAPTEYIYDDAYILTLTMIAKSDNQRMSHMPVTIGKDHPIYPSAKHIHEWVLAGCPPIF